MNRIFSVILLFVCTIWLQPSLGQGHEGDLSPAGDINTSFGGTGGVHILAEPGELTIDVAARNLKDVERELRAILVGPDRQVISEKRISTGQNGDSDPELQRARFQTKVERKGVYSLNITVSGGRMETGIVWGFQTNSERFLVESARGHRDADHEEPVILRNQDVSTDIWFQPRDGAFSIEITDLPESVEQLTLYDKQGDVIKNFDVAGGVARGTVSETKDPVKQPWRISFPSAYATLHIDGVTRWSDDDSFQHLSYWSTDGDSWFPYQEYRWLLTPPKHHIHGEESGAFTFEVYNNAKETRTVQLTSEFPTAVFDIDLVPDRVTLGSKESAEVTANYSISDEGESRTVHILAEPIEDPDFSTYATLVVHSEVPVAEEPITTPLILEPYRHENAQFGYNPDYPTDWELYFDLENQSFVRVDGGLMTNENGQWEMRSFSSDRITYRDRGFADASFELTRSDTKIAFDKDNEMYLVATASGDISPGDNTSSSAKTGEDSRRLALLHSADQGQHLTAYDLGVDGNFDIENFTGHNIPDDPPPILRSVLTYTDEERIWRRIHKLELIVVEKKEEGLVVNEPVLISDMSLGVGTHSGHASAIVSRGDRVHVIWGEATDPGEDVPGVPTYVNTYNRSTGQLEGDPVLIGYGPPANNVHNRPSITIDSKGYLHALIGTHGQPFLYTRSLASNDAHSGWTEPEMLSEEEEMRQTYIGLVCGPDDTLHLVYRLWRYSEQPHPAAHHAALAYQKKSPDSAWTEPRLLVLPPFSEYSIFYHRLGIDRRGRLMLSYDYWSTWWFYRNEYREDSGHFRKTMMSPDNGSSWQFLYNKDL